MKMLCELKGCLKTAQADIWLWSENKRMIMLLLLISAVTAQFCFDLNDFSKSIGATTNIIAILPYLYSIRYFRLCIQFGIVLMFSNAPFRSGNSLFQVIRTGYTKWCVGQIVYIIISSAAYVFTLFLLCIIFTLSSSGFSLTWGKTFSTLAQTSGWTYRISYGLQLKYAPVEALVNTALLLFLLSVLLGMTMFLLSNVVGHGAGIIAASAIVLFGLVPDMTQNHILIITLSPCSLTQIENLDSIGISGYPSLAYAYTFLLVGITILISVSATMFSNKKIRQYVYSAEVW